MHVSVWGGGSLQISSLFCNDQAYLEHFFTGSVIRLEVKMSSDLNQRKTQINLKCNKQQRTYKNSTTGENCNFYRAAWIIWRKKNKNKSVKNCCYCCFFFFFFFFFFFCCCCCCCYCCWLFVVECCKKKKKKHVGTQWNSLNEISPWHSSKWFQYHLIRTSIR